MKRLLFLLFTLGLTAIFPRTILAASCSAATDIGKAYCTCDDGAVPTEVAGSSFTSDSCNSACYDNGSDSWALAECTNPNPSNVLEPMDQDNVSDPLSANVITTTESGGTSTTAAPDYSVPNLNVPIPGFEKENNTNNGFSLPTISADKTRISVNFLAEYINAVYGWVLGAAALVAVVMMMIGGLQYVMARGKSKYIEAAKARITNAITGMVLLLATYSIMNLVDPRLTSLASIGITDVKQILYFPPDGEDTDGITPIEAPAGDGTVSPIPSSHHITSYEKGGSFLNADALAGLQAAGDAVYNSGAGKGITVTSSFRTLSKQAEMFYDNCLSSGKGCKPITCNPAYGLFTSSKGIYSIDTTKHPELATVSMSSRAAVISAIIANGNPVNCPHTSAVAVDVWVTGNEGWRADPEIQVKLMQAMIANGFCRLKSESWHFEWTGTHVTDGFPEKTCSTSYSTATYTNRKGTFTPSNCQKWDYENDKCSVEKH